MATQDATTYLYNETHTVTYKNASHKYYVNGTPIPSVTTIMGKILAKPELMLWPLNLAMKYLTERLPTISDEDMKMARTAHVRKREDGANTGTAVHYLIEQRLRTPLNRPLLDGLDDVPEDVRIAASAFDSWYLRTKPKPLATEEIIYSPSYNYVGTYDAILVMDGKTYLCDMKTTNPSAKAPRGVYAEHFMQLGAYYAAYEEQRIFELNTKGHTKLHNIDDLMVISVKKSGGVEVCSAQSIGHNKNDIAKAWQSLMTVYRTMTALQHSLAYGGVM